MGGAGATRGGVPAEGEDPAAGPAPDDRGDRLAARERGALAGDPGGTRPVVAGGAALHPVGQARGMGAAARGGARGRRRARHGVPGRDEHQGAPEGDGRAQKRGTSAQRDRREALGRSRGGFGTKACIVADGRGRAVAFALAPGQAHELPPAPGLLDRLPRVPLWVVGDRGYSSDAFRELVWSKGARPAIPTRSNEAAVACPASSTTTATSSSGSGVGSRSGGPSPPATRRQRPATSACSASPPPPTGSSPNRA